MTIYGYKRHLIWTEIQTFLFPSSCQGPKLSRCLSLGFELTTGNDQESETGLFRLRVKGRG